MPNGIGLEPVAQEGDDAEFVALVERLVSGLLQQRRPAECYLTHLDNWFGRRWLGFSGKVLGALGRWENRLTVPPFHPHRVRSERYYVGEGEPLVYRRRSPSRPLHRRQASHENLHRRVLDFTQSGLLVWYSGRSDLNRRGSLLVYQVAGEATEAWYVSLQRDPQWRLAECAEIAPETVHGLLGW